MRGTDGDDVDDGSSDRRDHPRDDASRPAAGWRFADGPTTSVSRVVDATAAEVWRLVSDIELPAAGSDELERVEWLDEDGPRVGARFVGHNRRGETAWSVTCVVTAYEPEERFAWDALVDPEAAEPEAQSSWRFELEPTGGGTRVTQRVRFGPGRSGLTWAIRQDPDREAEFIARRLATMEASMTRTLDHLATT